MHTSKIVATMLAGALLTIAPAVSNASEKGPLDLYWDAGVVLEITTSPTTGSLCSGFFAHDLSGKVYLWTAGHCCSGTDPNHPQYPQTLVVVGQKPNTTETYSGAFGSGDEIIDHILVDALGQDICRIDVPKGFPYIPAAVPQIDIERLNDNGESIESTVLFISMRNIKGEVGYVCTPVSFKRHLVDIEGGKERLTAGATCGGQSGGMVVSMHSGKIVGVVTRGTSLKNEERAKLKNLKAYSSYAPFTYSQWFFDKLLKKKFPPLPAKPLIPHN